MMIQFRRKRLYPISFVLFATFQSKAVLAQSGPTDEGLSAAGAIAEESGSKGLGRGLGRLGTAVGAASAVDNARQGNFPEAVGDAVGTLVGAFTVPAFTAGGTAVAPGAGTVIGATVGTGIAIRAGNEAENSARSIGEFFGDNRSDEKKRLDNVGLDPADFANSTGADLRAPGGLAQFEADLRREALRREAALAVQNGESFIPDPKTLDEIRGFEESAAAERQRVFGVGVGFDGLESQMQTSLAGQTTGLSSHIGDARTDQSARELERILGTTPDGPFVTTVETPDGMSSGEFSGDEGLNVAGVLNVFAFDSGALQDGDRVRITVRDSQGVRLSRTFTLTFGGRNSRVSARRGVVNVTITALNEGSAPPNTGGLRVSGDVTGSRSRNFNLSTGRSGTLAVRVLGN